MKAKHWAAGLCSILVASLLAAVPSGAAVSVGHSGWRWGNPLPQGNTIRVLDFNGGTGYAAGDFGTLLKTPDAGATCTGLPRGLPPTHSRSDPLSPPTVRRRGRRSGRRPASGTPP